MSIATIFYLIIIVIIILEDSCRKKRIDEALVRMISMDLQHTSIVEDKGFHAFLKVIDPKYIPPSQGIICQNYTMHANQM